jgi:hypothetical protein
MPPADASRRDLLFAAGAALAATPATAADPFHRLAAVGDTFSMAVIADPQVEGADARGVVAATATRKLAATVDELNARPPAVVVFNGDLVNSVKPEQISNFLAHAKRLTPTTILTHGNHDGHHPYPEFRAMQRAVNGTDLARFSFDCGRWHFVTIPCNFKPTDPYAGETLDWLAADLAAHRGRPTVAFVHYHLMPVGLSQLEWYTYDKPYRRKLLDILTAAGNVRWVVHGHVHNGVQTSAKTAWTWRGVNFLVCPTCTASRQFGEEFPEFAAGLPQGDRDSGGGYYLMFDFAGEDATVRGRLVGTAAEYTFPTAFREYRGEEPLWLADAGDLATPGLENGDFERKLAGWHRPHRYLADRDPGFVATARSADPGTALYLRVREKGQHWAMDEVEEAYQVVAWDPAAAPTLRLRVKADGPSPLGGGYARVQALAGRKLVRTFVVTWGGGDLAQTKCLSQNALYTATGRQGGPFGLLQLGQRKEALFWHVAADPGRWHDLTLDLPAAADAAGGPGTFAGLKADRLLVAVGVWCLKDPGAVAAAWFDDVRLAPARGEASAFGGTPLPLGPGAFATAIGREAWDKRKAGGG